MSSFYDQHPNFLKEVKGNALLIDFNRNSEVEQYCIVCVYVQHESPYLPMIGYCLWAGEGESLRGRPSISAPFTRSSACASKAQEVSRTLIHKNERTFMKAAPIRCSSEREGEKKWNPGTWLCQKDGTVLSVSRVEQTGLSSAGGSLVQHR